MHRVVRAAYSLYMKLSGMRFIQKLNLKIFLPMRLPIKSLLITVTLFIYFICPEKYLLPVINTVNDKLYNCDDNCCEVKNVSVHFDNDTSDNTKSKGTFSYENATGKHTIEFGTGYNIIQQFPDYNLKCAISGAWRMDSYFLIKVQIIDSAIGNIFIGLNFKDNYHNCNVQKDRRESV